jgi:hypothetical protein
LQLALPKIGLFHGLIGQAFLPVKRKDRMPRLYRSSYPP